MVVCMYKEFSYTLSKLAINIKHTPQDRRYVRAFLSSINSVGLSTLPSSTIDSPVTLYFLMATRTTTAESGDDIAALFEAAPRQTFSAYMLTPSRHWPLSASRHPLRFLSASPLTTMSTWVQQFARGRKF